MTGNKLLPPIPVTSEEIDRLEEYAMRLPVRLVGDTRANILSPVVDNWWAFLLLAEWRGDSSEKPVIPPPAVDSTTDRLARACAHGVRQKELVNELLMGPVKVVKFFVPGGLGMQSVMYGNAGVDPKSFQNLRRRLSTNGFFFVRSKDGTKIEMKFSR